MPRQRRVVLVLSSEQGDCHNSEKEGLTTTVSHCDCIVQCRPQLSLAPSVIINVVLIIVVVVGIALTNRSEYRFRIRRSCTAEDDEYERGAIRMGVSATTGIQYQIISTDSFGNYHCHHHQQRRRR